MLVQLIASGVSQGALYALFALSMTVVYRATTVINFGHGDLVMGAAFLVFVLTTYAGLPFALAGLAATVIMFAAGVFIQRGLIQPVLSGPHLTLAMMTVALGYLFRGIARAIWGGAVIAMPSALPSDVYQIGPAIVGTSDLVTVGTVIVLLAIFFWVFYRTRAGKLIQAVYQNPRGAALVGIPVNRFFDVMWGIGVAMAAIGGILLAANVQLQPDMGVQLLIRGFAAMTLGGMGSLWGSVIGGLLLGVMETLAGFYIASSLIDITAYLVIIVVLLIRPAGLFGRRKMIRV